MSQSHWRDLIVICHYAYLGHQHESSAATGVQEALGNNVVALGRYDGWTQEAQKEEARNDDAHSLRELELDALDERGTHVVERHRHLFERVHDGVDEQLAHSLEVGEVLVEVLVLGILVQLSWIDLPRVQQMVSTQPQPQQQQSRVSERVYLN